ncbi:MAG: hypothetical protein ACR2QH_03115 [Geminicoccaceae bacterium]
MAVNPNQGEHDLVVLEGLGQLVSANLSNQSGTTDLTFVSLSLEVVVRRVIAVLSAFVESFGH